MANHFRFLPQAIFRRTVELNLREFLVLRVLSRCRSSYSSCRRVCGHASPTDDSSSRHGRERYSADDSSHWDSANSAGDAASLCCSHVVLFDGSSHRGLDSGSVGSIPGPGVWHAGQLRGDGWAIPGPGFWHPCFVWTTGRAIPGPGFQHPCHLVECQCVRYSGVHSPAAAPHAS